MQTGEHEKVYSSQNEAFWGEQGDPRLTFKWLERSGGGKVRGRLAGVPWCLLESWHDEGVCMVPAGAGEKAPRLSEGLAHTRGQGRDAISSAPIKRGVNLCLMA